MARFRRRPMDLMTIGAFAERTRHVHAHAAGPFFSDSFARLRAVGPGIEGIAGCPFVVYYGGNVGGRRPAPCARS
jgi:hypothetical protein